MLRGTKASQSASGQRHKRLGSVILRELTPLLQEFHEFYETQITEVILTTDCRFARIFVRKGLHLEAQSENDPELVHFVKQLNAHASRWQGELGKLLNIRYVPKIQFEYDFGLERAERVLSIINSLPK